MPILDDAIARLKQENPGAELHLLDVEDDDGAVVFEGVFRAPSVPLWKKFRTEVLNEQTRLVADRNLVVACLAFPPYDVFAAAEARFPAIVGKIGSSIADLAGADHKVKVRKL